MSDLETSALKGVLETKFLGGLFSLLKPRELGGTVEYAEKNIYLSAEVTSNPGNVDCSRTPCFLAFFKYADDPNSSIIVGMKPAQIGWTQAVNFLLEKWIVTDPQNIMIAFPCEGLIKKYTEEKFKPAIRSSRRLTELIGNPDNSRFDFFKFAGGWVSLVSAGSDNKLKSSPAGKLIVEEPDGLKQDLKGQGAALSIFSQRCKTFPNSLIIYAGTPTEEGKSNVAAAYEQSNKMIFLVRCHECEKFHKLSFDNLKAEFYPNKKIDKVYGVYNPETAYYQCPECFARWDDEQKNINLLTSTKYHDLGWVATAESHIIGFAYNELMSTFMAGSTLVNLMRTKLEAEIEFSKGKEGKLKSFINNSKGEPSSTKSIGIDEKALKEARLNYPEFIVPAGGIILTLGIDVQHNRFACILRAWGRGGNSWLVWWGEIFGYVKDPENVVWKDLTEFALAKIPHSSSSPERKIELAISAISIDSGDGNTTELVYSWVKQMNKINPFVFATKGDGVAGTHQKEIFNVPIIADTTSSYKSSRKRLMETMGIHPYYVGVQTAKDEVLRKLTLTGGKDRSYHYKDCREDYEEQILSNRKRGNPPRHELILGKRDEVLDCEVLALHASRAINIHRFTEKHWQQAESLIVNTSPRVRQSRGGITGGLDL